MTMESKTIAGRTMKKKTSNDMTVNRHDRYSATAFRNWNARKFTIDPVSDLTPFPVFALWGAKACFRSSSRNLGFAFRDPVFAASQPFLEGMNIKARGQGVFARRPGDHPIPLSSHTPRGVQ